MATSLAWAPAYLVGETPRVPERLVEADLGPAAASRPTKRRGSPNEKLAEAIMDITFRRPYGMGAMTVMFSSPVRQCRQCGARRRDLVDGLTQV